MLFHRVAAISTLAVILLAGCSEASLEDRVAAAFKNIVAQQLKDPSSAQFDSVVVRQVVLPNVTTLGSGGSGFYAYARVRGTNSFGGVVPQNFQGFFSADGAPLFVGTPGSTPWGETIDELDNAERWMNLNLPNSP